MTLGNRMVITLQDSRILAVVRIGCVCWRSEALTHRFSILEIIELLALNCIL